MSPPASIQVRRWGWWLRNPSPVYGSGRAMRKFVRPPICAAELRTPGGVGASDYFECPFTNTLQRLAQFLAGIAAIGEDKAQPWVERADRSEHARGTIAILNVGLMHNQPDQIALRVGDDVAFAAFDLLSCVIAPRAAALRGFHRLAVNHSGRRARLSASRLARRHNERGSIEAKVPLRDHP